MSWTLKSDGRHIMGEVRIDAQLDELITLTKEAKARVEEARIAEGAKREALSALTNNKRVGVGGNWPEAISRAHHEIGRLMTQIAKLEVDPSTTTSHYEDQRDEV